MLNELKRPVIEALLGFSSGVLAVAVMGTAYIWIQDTSIAEAVKSHIAFAVSLPLAMAIGCYVWAKRAAQRAKHKSRPLLGAIILLGAICTVAPGPAAQADGFDFEIERWVSRGIYVYDNPICEGRGARVSSKAEAMLSGARAYAQVFLNKPSTCQIIPPVNHSRLATCDAITDAAIAMVGVYTGLSVASVVGAGVRAGVTMARARVHITALGTGGVAFTTSRYISFGTHLCIGFGIG